MIDYLQLEPIPYLMAIPLLADILRKEKSLLHPHKAMLVGIEGLSNCGKSTFASSLEQSLLEQGIPAFSIEGDKFHVGRNSAMPIYRRLIEAARQGNSIPVDFPNLIWRFPMLKEQVLDPVTRFNNSQEKERAIELYDILHDKYDSTEHTEEYSVKRDSIILVPSMYLHHLSELSFILRLNVSPHVSVERKIARDLKKGILRDPAVTKEMVFCVEYPALLNYDSQFLLDRGLTIDANNFSSLWWHPNS